VAGVSLQLKAGRSLALLGPNGAGKTTLVEMLEGLQQPDRGASVSSAKAGRRASPRPLGPSWASACRRAPARKAEGLGGPRALRQLPRPGQRRAKEVLRQVGLDEKAKAYSEGLSGGQRQRLALGVAMLSRPKLLAAGRAHHRPGPAARREVWAWCSP